MAESQETAAQSLASIASTTDPALLAPSQTAASPKKRFRSSDPKSTSPVPGLLQPTGFSEMAEAKRRKTAAKDTTPVMSSRNPAFDAANALTSGQATSKPADAPTTTISSATSTSAPSITIPETAGVSSAQTSPATTAGSETLNAPQTTSPGGMEQDGEAGEAGGNKAFSYPGPLLNAQSDPKRGMSLPGSDSRDGKAGNKKHKCPYCSTEFTRHHNLKSHLLTHSHEKPYLCQTCDSRFRRLHDLKRHTKLHTGERPHICPKCNRRFARGDALARHAKGQGGCAGRRSSVGEFGNEDESMDGLVYADGQSHEPEGMEDDEAGGSVPSIRHHAPAHSPYRGDSGSSFGRQGTTYPPIASRANMGLQPPHQSSSSSNSGPYSGSYPPAGVFPTSQMTESPKPLSPGNVHPPPPLSQSYPPPARRRGTPPPSLGPPGSGTQLPSLSGLAPPDSRFTLHSTPGAPGPSPTLPHPASGTFPPHSASNSLSSHGTGPHTSGERGNMPFTNEDRLWAVIKSLEAKVDSLQEEVRMLRAQQTGQAGPGHSLTR